MEDYVLYPGQIGRGRHSEVHKGRMTGSLDYVAIQSYEKSQTAKARAKFHNAGVLEHPNVLRVSKWCETTSHHWLVSEYCPGGDFEAMLREDVRLELGMVKQFALDIAAGLQHCHSRGVVVGDLRPAKVLVDNGWLKIGGLASGLVVTDPPSEQPDGRELLDGGVLYRSPEIVTGGARSRTYVSDLWALGCIIYEMAAGTPPFVSDDVKLLDRLIIETDVPGVPDPDDTSPGDALRSDAANVSARIEFPDDLAELLGLLLRKDPARRPTWNELEAHRYWEGSFPTVSTDSIEAHMRRTLGLRGPIGIAATRHERPIQPGTRVGASPGGGAVLEMPDVSGLTITDLTGGSSIADSIHAAAAAATSGGDMPKPVSERRSGSTYPPQVSKPPGTAPNAAWTEQGQCANGRGRPSADAVVMGDATVARRTSTAPPDFDRIRTKTDAVARQTPSRLPRPSAKSAHARSPRAKTSASKPPVNDRPIDPQPDVTNAAHLPGGDGNGTNFNPHQTRVILRNDTALSDEGQRSDKGKKKAATQELASLPSVAPMPPTSPSPGDAADTSTPGTGRSNSVAKRATLSGKPGPAADPQAPGTAARANWKPTGGLIDPSSVSNNPILAFSLDDQVVDELFLHESDVIITGLIGNPKIEKLVLPKLSDIKGSAFMVHRAPKWSEMSELELGRHVDEIAKIISAAERSRQRTAGLASDTQAGAAGGRKGSAHVAQRNAVTALKYLQTVCTNVHVANVVANSVLMENVSRLLKSGPDLHREHAALVIGIVMRHATMIADEIDMAELVTTLADVLRDQFRNVLLKRRLVAAIGEALFYIASQAAASDDPLPPLWTVPSAVYAMVRRCIRDDDAVVCHYAAKMIENVAHVANIHAHVLATKEMGLLLWTVFSHHKESAIRKSCAAALSKLTRVDSTVLQHIIDKAGPRAVLETLRDSSSRVRQSFLTALLFVMSERNACGRAQSRMLEEPHLVDAVMAVAEDHKGPAATLRAKCYLLFVLVARSNLGLLFQALRGRLLHLLERDARPHRSRGHHHQSAGGEHPDTYLLEAGGLLLRTITDAIPALLEPLNHVLLAISGRKRPSVVQIKALKAHVGSVPAVLSVVRSWLTHGSVCQHPQFCEMVGTLVHQLVPVIDHHTDLDDVSPTAATDLVDTAIAIVEILAKNLPTLPMAQPGFVNDILPVFPELLRSVDPDMRLSAVQVLTSAITMLVAEVLPEQSSSEQQEWGYNWKPQIRKLFETQLFGSCSALLTDSDPIPIHVIRLLGVMSANDPGFAAVVLDHDLGPAIVSQLQRDCSVDPKRSASPVSPAVLDSEHTALLVLDLVDSSRGNDGSSALDLCSSGGLAWRLTRSLGAAVDMGEHAESLLLTLMQIQLDLLGSALPATAAVSGVDPSRSRQLTAPLLDTVPYLIKLLEDPEAGLHAMRCIAKLFEVHNDSYPVLFSQGVRGQLGPMINCAAEPVRTLLLQVIKRAFSASTDTIKQAQRTESLRVAIISASDGSEVPATRDSLNGSLPPERLSPTLSQALAADLTEQLLA